MRWILVVSVAASIALLTSATACGTSCTLVGCANTGTAVEMSIRKPLDVVAGSRVTRCLNGVCVTGRPFDTAVESTGAHERRRLSFDGGFLTDVGDGWTQLQLLLRPPGGEVAGDRARVEVVGAAGDVLLAVERPLAFSGGYLNGGEQCGPWCASSGTSRLYEQSASGIMCTANRCASHVTLRVAVAASSAALRSKVRICRNDWCGETEGTIAERSNEMRGDLRGVVLMSGGHQYTLVFYLAFAEPAVLADGDRYSATILDTATGETLKRLERVVTYDTPEYPNGRECDPYPCRSASIVLE